MKKVITVLLALFGIAMYTNAATVDEVQSLTQSYVCVFGDYTSDGAGTREKGVLFGDNYFFDATGGALATNKGSIDIADVSTYIAINGADVEALAAKYTTLGARLNCLRLKNAQDVIAFKPVAGSKVYVFGNGNNKSGVSARIPKFAKDAALTEALNEAPGEDHPATANYVYEFTVPEGFDGTVPMYVGSYNGDAFFSFIVVETATSGYDLTAYNEAVANAEAFKATLAADTCFEKEMIEELIVAIDEALVFAQEGVDVAASQEDVDISTNMLNETVGMYKGNYDAQVLGFKIEEVRVAGQEALDKYPEETRVDNAGLVEALMNLPMRTMGYTAEQLQAAIDAVETAIPVFEKENNQVILDAAKKKATDYAATLDTSEETGSMAQMEAYNTLAYYISDAFFTESGVTADSYDMVMAYSQQIDMMIAQYEPQVQKEKSMMAATKAATEAQETMASYENATDEAGLAAAIAKVNEILGELNMWDTMYTIEDLNAAVDALATAKDAFVEENANAPVESNQLPSGTYYMKNVAADKYLAAGNSWGTQASLAVHGLDIKVEVLENGKYTFDTNIPNGTTRHYLCSNGFMDSDVAEWAVIEVAPQTYAITLDSVNYIGYDGSTSVVNLALTDAASPAAHWQFITKDELIAGMANATADSPVDATFFIVGQGFNRGDSNRNSAWQGSPVMGGANDNFCAEKWNCNFDIYQDLTGLPNGFYKLSAQGYYRAGNGGATSMERHAYLYAGEVSTPLQNINSEAGNSVFEGGNVSTVEGMGIVPNNMMTVSAAFTAGLYADNSVLVEVTDGTLRIGVKKDTLISSDWTMFDNFELVYYGTEKPAEEENALAAIVEKLATLLEEAITWKGELNGSDEMHAQVIATLEQMIPSVQAVIDNPESKEAVEQMIADVKAMLDTYMPMIEQYDAKVLVTLAIEGAQELMASYSSYTDNAGLAKAIAAAQTLLADLNLGFATVEELNAALSTLTTAQEAFLVENASDDSGIVDGIRQHPVSTITFIEAATDNTPMYMYNVGAQKFFLGANAWGTQTSVGDEGYKVYFEQYVVDAAAGWDGTTVIFRDSCLAKSGTIREVFFDNVNGGCFVDRGSQANYYWKLEKNAGNGYYRLSMAEANPDYQEWQVDTHPDTYVGWDASTGTTVVSSFLNPNVEGIHVDWAFVSVEEYEAFAGKLVIYNAAQILKEEIDKAKALSLDVSAQETVYLNMAATLAEIENATAEVRNILAAWDEGSVNPYIPVDKTSLIVNPSYSNNNNDGWSGTTPGFQSYTNAEHWNKTFDTYQDIANMPNGLYKLSVQGFFRPVVVDATGAVFYAENGTDRLTVDVPNINSESELETKPNNMQAAGNAFAAGYYNAELFVNVNAGTLRIGVTLPQLTGIGDWVMWDNWRLTYYGSSEDVYSILIDSLANTASYKFDGREAEMTVGTLDTYRATLSELTADDLASFNAARVAITDAEAAVQANIDAWVKYEELIVLGNNVRTNPSYNSSTAMQQLAVYVARQAPAILKAKTLSTEEVLAECDKLEQMIMKAISESLQDNADVTDMYLVNADFEDKTDGKADGQGWEGKWSAISSGLMEAYATDWDAYQVVRSAAAGVYEVSLQGFYRVKRGQEAYDLYWSGEQTCPGHVYVNNHLNAVKCVFDEPVKHIDGEYIYSAIGTGPESNPNAFIGADGDSIFFPNDMKTANEAFIAGMYKAAAYGLVAKQGDELRIGIKGQRLAETWVIWDNFKMIYRGKQIAYTLPYLQEAINKAYESLGNPMDKDTKALLETAISNAENHLSSTDEEAVFDALVQMYAANDSVEASAGLFAELNAAVEELQNAMMLYQATATDQAMVAATDLLTQILVGVEQSALTKAEAQALLAQVEPTINALIMGDYTNAGDENPMDFTALLASPSFEDFEGLGSAEGWTGATGARGSGAYEFYQKAFDLYQDLTGLPNGTYRLEVSAYERIGSSINDYETYLTGADTATTYFYGQSGTAYYDAPVRRLASGAIVSDDGFGIEGMTIVGTAASGEAVQVPNTMASAVVMFNDFAEYQNVMYVQVTDGTLRIGMKKNVQGTNDWVMMDNWRLYYHGTNSQYAPGYVPSDKEYSTTNTFSISDAETLKGSLFTLPVSMTNEDGISAFQCDIYLSSGLQMNLNDEGDYDIALNSTRATSSHTIASELQSDGAIRVIVYSSGNKLFKGNAGELFTMNLTASSLRNQSVAVRNIRMSTADEQEILTADVAADITVKTYTPADVNGDGTVSIVDVVAVVNNILGYNVGNFIFEAADMDQNGEITIVDVVAVVNALLGKDVQATGARSILRSDLHVADAEVNAGGTATFYVKLDNAQAYTAMQMDVTLPEGLSIEGVEMVGNPAHAAAYSETGRIVAYSLGNSRFNGGEALMAVTVKADAGFAGTAQVDFTNVRVVSKDITETVLADASANIAGGGANGIAGAVADEDVQVLYYSTTGAVSDKPHKGLNIIKRIYGDGRMEVSKGMME